MTGSSRSTLTRRRLLGLGFGVTVGATLAGVTVGLDRGAPRRQTDLAGRPAISLPERTAPAVRPASVVSGSFRSPEMGGTQVGWTLARPAAAQTLHPVIALHGKGGDHNSAFDELGLDRLLTQAVQVGTPPFAVVTVDGGDGYWHRRATGKDSGAMVLGELLPMLSTMGLDTSRVGFAGWSMGGYGALMLGAQLGPQRTAAIAAVSPALWTTSGAAAPGAFDTAADFNAHNMFDRTAELAQIPVRIDCGTSDPFYAATREFVGQLRPAPAGGFSAGGHDGDYWRHTLPDQLSFLGDHLR